MNLRFIDECINEKLQKDSECVKFTFFELRIKNNLTEAETLKFLELAKNKFENMNYNVYFTNEHYIYKDISYTVQSNELMVAVNKGRK